MYFLVQSFGSGSRSLHTISAYVPSRWTHSEPPFITKVTAIYDQNDIYESALSTHEAQNSLHGYDLRVLRERITNGWWSQAALLLSVVVGELSKAKEERTEWLLWFQPDVVVLNPEIPLEIFLPLESDLEDVHFLASHDDQGQLDSGVFFLRVHEWSARMLTEVLATPRVLPGLQLAPRKDRFALAAMISSETFRDNVLYQPRNWYNAYALSAETSEYGPGDMQLHFHDTSGDRWSGMSRTLNFLSTTPSKFSVPLERTTYPKETQEYWNRIQTARRLLQKAQDHSDEQGVQARLQRLGYAMNYEADKAKVMQEGIDGLRDALGVTNGEHAI